MQINEIAINKSHNTPKTMASTSIVLLVFLLSLQAKLTVCAVFIPEKHIYYEMFCKSSNKTTIVTLSDIELNVLDHSNFIYESDNQILGVQNCHWNWSPRRHTRIFIHGYYSDRKTFMKYAHAYLRRGDYNFIAINWLRGARTINYFKARRRVQLVGEATARFIDYLVTLGMHVSDLIMIGHSLGAHVCGIAAKHIKSGKPAAIIGLDPAFPLFRLLEQPHRLHYDDAKYVQIIHTNGGFLGIRHPIGHADFYPNFGCVQPSCKSIIPCKYTLYDILKSKAIYHFSLLIPPICFYWLQL